MKALLIADDEKAITNISEVLKSAGYDVIVYKWLLKAMDNLEEIKPHLIVVSTKDYPRHWKTLAQYSSNIKTDYRPEMILYSPEKLSDEELKKAETLRVRGIFDSCEVDGLDKLREILSKRPDIFSGYLTEPEQGEVTLKDLIPELDEQNLKTISEDINSLKEELNKPFDINEAIAELEKAKEKEADANTDSTQINTDEQDSKDSNSENQDSTQIHADGKESSQIENLDDEEAADEVEEVDEVEPENSDEAEKITQNEDEKQNEILEVKTEPDESQTPENEENQKNLEVVHESDIIEEDENQKSEDDEISESESENDSEPKDEKMNEEDIEAKLAAIMNANKADAKEKAEEAGIDNYSCSFVFTNPITLALVTGTARNYNGMTLEFMPDIPNFIMNLAPDTQISDASLKVNGEISDVKAEVMSNDAKKLYLQIKK